MLRFVDLWKNYIEKKRYYYFIIKINYFEGKENHVKTNMMIIDKFLKA